MVRRRRTRTRKSSGNWVLPVGVLAVLAACLAWGVVRLRDVREAARPPQASRRAAETETDPFGELALDGRADPREASGTDPFGESGGSLLDDAEWTAAVALAARAEELYEASVAAKLAGDRGVMIEKGRAAVKRFQTALTDTEELEATLVMRYGEQGALTRQVLRARKQWLDRVVFLHKTATH